MQPLYTTAEVAAKLNLPIRTVQYLARTLGGTKKGRVWRFPPEEIARARREDVAGRKPGRPRGQA